LVLDLISLDLFEGLYLYFQYFVRVVVVVGWVFLAEKKALDLLCRHIIRQQQLIHRRQFRQDLVVHHYRYHYHIHLQFHHYLDHFEMGYRYEYNYPLDLEYHHNHSLHPEHIILFCVILTKHQQHTHHLRVDEYRLEEYLKEVKDVLVA